MLFLNGALRKTIWNSLGFKLLLYSVFKDLPLALKWTTDYERQWMCYFWYTVTSASLGRKQRDGFRLEGLWGPAWCGLEVNGGGQDFSNSCRCGACLNFVGAGARRERRKNFNLRWNPIWTQNSPVPLVTAMLDEKLMLHFTCMVWCLSQLISNLARLINARDAQTSSIAGRITFIFMNHGRKRVQDIIFYKFSVLRIRTEPSFFHTSAWLCFY